MNDWENPTLTGVNKETGHSLLVPFSTRESVLAADRTGSGSFKLLNGVWKFSYFETPSEVPEDFSKRISTAANGRRSPVPSNWQMEGWV